VGLTFNGLGRVGLLRGMLFRVFAFIFVQIKTNQKAALYNLLVSYATLLKRGEKFFRLPLFQ